jgi:hypothetical protein
MGLILCLVKLIYKDMKYLKIFETGKSFTDSSHIKFELEKVKDKYKPLIPYCSISNYVNRSTIFMFVHIDDSKYGTLYSVSLQADFGYDFLEMNDKLHTEQFMLDIQNKLESIIENETILVSFQLANAYVGKVKVPNKREMVDVSDKYKDYIKKVASSNLDDLKDDDLASTIESIKRIDNIEVDFKIKYGYFVYLIIKLDNTDIKKDIIDELHYMLNIWNYQIRELGHILFIDIITDKEYLNIDENDFIKDDDINWFSTYKLVFLAPNLLKLESFENFKL